MGGRCKWFYLLCCFSLTLFSAFGGRAQSGHVSGLVSDAGDGKPMAGVIVLAKDAAGTTTGYAITDAEGHFSLQMKESAVLVEFSMVGYVKETLNRPFGAGALSILMQESKETIASAVIKGRSVRVLGDTLIYSAAAVRAETDRTLGDVLQRLPGIELQRNGRVLYNGRAISRLYVDGRDILRGDYNMATDNLDAAALKTIEVYQNHQPVKALSGLVEDESAALNIVLNDLARGRWSFRFDVSGGYIIDGAPFAYKGEALATNISSKFATLNKIGVNNVGLRPHYNELNSSLSIGEDRFNRYRLRDYFSISPDTAPLSDEHSAMNKSRYAQTLDNYAVGENTTLGIAFKFADEEMSSILENLQTFAMTDTQSEVEFVDITQKNVDSRYLSIAADLTSNARNRYIKDVLFFDYRRSKGDGEIKGAVPLQQSLAGDRWNINHILTTRFRTSEGQAYGLNWYSQYSRTENMFSVSPDTKRQDMSANVFYSSLTGSGFSRSRGGWSLAFTPGLYLTTRTMSSLYAGNYPDNAEYAFSLPFLHTLQIRPQLDASVSYYYRSWRFEAAAQAAYFYYGVQTRQTWDGKSPLLGGGLSARYASGYVTIDAGWKHGYRTISDQTLVPVAILHTHNTFWVGRHDLPTLLVDRLWGEIRVQEPLSGTFLSLHAERDFGEDFLLVRQVSDKYVFNIESDEIVSSSDWDAGVKLSKGLALLRGKIDAGANFSSNSSRFRQNETLSYYQSCRWDFYLRLKTNPLRWLEINYDGSADRSIFFVEKNRQESPSFRMRQTISGTMRPMEWIEFFVSGEHQQTVLDGRQDHFLLDAGASVYLGRSLKLYLQGVNLLGVEAFRVISSAPLFTMSQEYHIRPTTIMLGIEWRR